MVLETLFGGVTGLIGTLAGGWFKLKQAKLDMEIKKQDHNFELQKIEKETESMIAETKANIRMTESKIEGEVELRDADIYALSQKEGNKSLFSNKWIDGLLSITGWWRIITLPIASLIAILFGVVDFIRGLVRPVLTLYLVAVTTWVTWMAWQIMQIDGIALTNIQATEIFKDIISTVTYLTISAVLWWFGDRRLAKSINKAKGLDVNKLDDKIEI